MYTDTLINDAAWFAYDQAWKLYRQAVEENAGKENIRKAHSYMIRTRWTYYTTREALIAASKEV